MTGEKRITQLDANRVLDEAKARREAEEFPAPVSARAAADMFPMPRPRVSRPVGGFVGTALFIVVVAFSLSVVLGVARLMGAL